MPQYSIRYAHQLLVLSANMSTLHVTISRLQSKWPRGDRLSLARCKQSIETWSPLTDDVPVVAELKACGLGRLE